jgi:hypothetical protein
MSLIELIGVMAAGAVLVSVAVVTLASLLRNDRRFAARLDGQRSLTELADQLRTDVHAAAEATWDAAAGTLRLTAADGDRVEYAMRPARCVRRESQAGDDEWRLAGVYRTPARTEWSATVERLRERSLVRVELSWPRPGTRSDAKRQQSEIIAIVGRDAELLYP